ncbi:MAG: prepilin-type N-terminal cleavage/methylation domain-containing protein [Betaproteobacteria bacterium AqS2]|uniref:Prepilin-type N-terminal cleavage/methylation domain-containing protein n=1 Tax=Candidatus Amphirhobacter heronislandensis TaxID=1732024 RepID=A0A930XYM4_9GAMM|nr:prepilin-type N-terminal cleavage/methylation domain-containing protein [Betaproteobacteria bacterium AqS2]
MKTRIRIAASRGFTLVEIAIVLAVAGLLLGGVLKGQELINSAKVRAIADRQGELQKSALLFIDRYGALPGDLENASLYIDNARDGSGDGFIAENESPLAFQHLTASGFLKCEVCTETSTASSMRSRALNSPINRYGGVMSLWHDTEHYAFVSISFVRPTQPLRLQTHTGPRIPSNIMREVDRRLDDDTPNKGRVRFNDYDPTGALEPTVEDCTEYDRGNFRSPGTMDGRARLWRRSISWPPIVANCGGSIIIQ